MSTRILLPSAMLGLTSVALAVATLTVSPDLIDFGNVAPNAVIPSKSFRVTNTGNTSGTFTTQVSFQSGGNWFTISPSSGTVQPNGGFVSVNVQPRTGLGNGNYEGTITVRDGSNVVVGTVNVVLGVSGALLVVAPTQLSINIPFGAATGQATFTATLQGGGSADLIPTPSGGSWLSVSPQQSPQATQETFTVTASRAQISGTSASGAVQVRCENGSPCTAQVVSVNVTVAPNVTLNSPGGVSFEGASGGNAVTRSLALSSSNNSTLGYSISVTEGNAWLSATSASNSTQSPLSITANPRSLAAGSYTGQIRLTPSNGAPAVTIPVTFAVASGALTLSAPSISFSASTAAACGNRTISVASGGPGVGYTVRSAVATPAGGTWLSATPEQGTTPGSFTAYCDARGLSAGTYTGSVTLTSSAPGTQPLTVPVTLTVGEPAIAVVSAASGQPQIAPAMIASLYGSGLASATEAATTSPLPTTLAGRSVTVRDSAGATRTSPLFFVSSGQINFEIPAATAAGAATVTVLNGQQTVATGTVTISKVAPGLFTQPGGIAAALAARYFPDGTSVPVSVFTCTSTTCTAVPMNVTNGAVYLSLYGTGIRNAASLDVVQCTVAGRPVPVLFAGDQRTYPGLDQVNVQLPASLAGLGEVELQLVVEGVASAKVKIAIQ